MMTTETQTIIEEFATRVRAKLGDRVKHIILFGSRARDDAGPESDYDVLMVLDEDTKEARYEIIDIEYGIQDETDAFIVCIHHDEKQFKNCQRLRTPLYRNIEAEGIPF